MVGIALVACAITSSLNAIEHPRLVITAMSAPVWIFAGAALLVCDFFLLRRWCIWMSGCFAIALPLVFTITPLNIPRGEVPKKFKAGEWNLLSYNVCNFFDVTGKYPGKVNPGVSYILRTNADVVFLAEGQYTMPIKATRFTEAQMDSLRAVYPYILVGSDVTLLSKFPAETLTLDAFPNQLYNRTRAESKVGGYLLDIHGKKTVLIGVHLQSLGLTSSDKKVYKDFTRGEGFASRSDLREAERDIVGKISRANLYRAYAINAVIKFINGLPEDYNLIVCGDFNDTPGCYSLRQLQTVGLREVYPLVGNGYMHTFYKDRLFFQIDHVLFRGNIRPWSMTRDRIRSSDHYPLLTTFIED